MKYILIKKFEWKKKIISKIFLMILLLLINLKIYDSIENYLIIKEIKLIKEYYKINKNKILLNIKNTYKSEYPKVSIISSVYNREKYIPIFIRSIQNQILVNIELIFVDDCSEDNSIEIIERYKNNDSRIILIKNKKNKGTLISRNIGALKARGEFLVFPDSDDILSRDILNICYKTCKTYNYDLVRFNMYSDRYFIFGLIDIHLKREIFQPELRTYLIYGYGYQKLVDGIISNKFIRKTLYLISLNNIDVFFINQKMIYFEDGLINLALHFNAKSLYLLNHIGYYYIFNKDSISHFINLDLYLRCFFIFLKFFVDYTKKNKYEQEMNFFILNEYIYNNNLLNNITNYSNIYEEIINSLLNNKFISKKDLKKIKILKKIILNPLQLNIILSNILYLV
jgi:glycosyltransferase involved in cell wall biosynthesis